VFFSSATTLTAVAVAFWEVWGMSTIHIERSHQLDIDSARAQLVEIEPMLRERYGIALDWSGADATIRGSGVSGSVHLGADVVRLDLKLGFVLRPLAGKIRSAVEAELDKALG